MVYTPKYYKTGRLTITIINLGKYLEKPEGKARGVVFGRINSNNTSETEVCPKLCSSRGLHVFGKSVSQVWGLKHLMVTVDTPDRNR